MILDPSKSHIRSALKGWDQERDQAFKQKKITGIISLGRKEIQNHFVWFSTAKTKNLTTWRFLQINEQKKTQKNPTRAGSHHPAWKIN